MDYQAVKQLHVACVIVSVSLFTLRGSLQLKNIAWRRWRWLRIAPHLNDSVLLGAALWLVFQLPEGSASGWIVAKVLALIGYILIGRLALADTTLASRRPALFVAALLCVAYIIGVALTKSPDWGLLVP